MSDSSGCALINDGSVRCFGTNEFGDFGLPSGTGWSFGAANSFAMPGLTGAARCWGRNQTGQLGNGSSVDSVSPVTVWDFPTAGVR
jgi:alpha-tubulin suppressor-like RCC1 family protein